RTVHGSDSLQRQVVVHHGEHTFLHFSAVPCVCDYLLTACDVEHNSCLGCKTKLFIVFYFCFGSIVNNEIRCEVFQLFICRTDKHVCYKVCLPCNFHNETNRHTCIFVCSAECINNKQSLVGELFD